MYALWIENTRESGPHSYEGFFATAVVAHNSWEDHLIHQYSEYCFCVEFYQDHDDDGDGDDDGDDDEGKQQVKPSSQHRHMSSADLFGDELSSDEEQVGAAFGFDFLQCWTDIINVLYANAQLII